MEGNMKDIFNDIIREFPFNIISSPIREFDKDKPCQHEIFDKQLLNSGQCKTIEEARRKPRMLYCNCPKCKPTYL